MLEALEDRFIRFIPDLLGFNTLPFIPQKSGRPRRKAPRFMVSHRG